MSSENQFSPTITWIEAEGWISICIICLRSITDEDWTRARLHVTVLHFYLVLLFKNTFVIMNPDGVAAEWYIFDFLMRCVVKHKGSPDFQSAWGGCACVTFLCRKVKIQAQMLAVFFRFKGSSVSLSLTPREISDGCRVRGQRRRWERKRWDGDESKGETTKWVNIKDTLARRDCMWEGLQAGDRWRV